MHYIFSGGGGSWLFVIPFPKYGQNLDLKVGDLKKIGKLFQREKLNQIFKVDRIPLYYWPVPGCITLFS